MCILAKTATFINSATNKNFQPMAGNFFLRCNLKGAMVLKTCPLLGCQNFFVVRGTPRLHEYD